MPKKVKIKHSLFFEPALHQRALAREWRIYTAVARTVIYTPLSSMISQVIYTKLYHKCY